jgi:hypothetical protein
MSDRPVFLYAAIDSGTRGLAGDVLEREIAAAAHDGAPA